MVAGVQGQLRVGTSQIVLQRDQLKQGLAEIIADSPSPTRSAKVAMAQTEITGSDQAVGSVQPSSPLKPSADLSAFTHSHVEGPSHMLENGFETAEPPVPDDPGNNAHPSHPPLQTQPPPHAQELGMQQNGFDSSEHVAETSFPDETGGTTEGTSGSASSAAEEPEVKLDAGPAKDMNLPVNRRMWFVRVPRPAEDPNVRLLEREMESYKAQVRLLNESLAVKRVRPSITSWSCLLVHLYSEDPSLLQLMSQEPLSLQPASMAVMH